MKASTARRRPPGDPPRIAPLPADAWGSELAAAVEVAGPLALLTTLARHRDLFHAWLGLGAFLLLSGRLPHRVRELAILRTAHNTACVYIRAQHERLARAAGLGRAEIAATAKSSHAAFPWDATSRLILVTADELYHHNTLGDLTWAALAARFDDAELIELITLIGHYQMLACLLLTLRVQPEPTSEQTGEGAGE